MKGLLLHTLRQDRAFVLSLLPGYSSYLIETVCR